MNKFAKASLIALLCIFIVFVALISAYFAITHGVTLDKNKLLNPDRNVIIYDGDGNDVTANYLITTVNGWLTVKLPA